jgi:hypothetical protein
MFCKRLYSVYLELTILAPTNGNANWLNSSSLVLFPVGMNYQKRNLSNQIMRFEEEHILPILQEQL